VLRLRECTKKSLGLEKPMVHPWLKYKLCRDSFVIPINTVKVLEGAGRMEEMKILLAECFLHWSWGRNISCVPQIMFSTWMECVGNATLAFPQPLCLQLFSWWASSYSHEQSTGWEKGWGRG
jgi:hypothetical protein